jgi:DNA-binding PadR family transcriptional regulator
MAVTELEGVILGIVSSRQPCSAYVVRSRFEESPTWGWRKSKGAIYPAVSRLVARGCLASERTREGRVQKELLSLTPSGKTELVGWMLALGEEMGGAPVDPVRTRVNYLGNLSPTEREGFLSRAEEAARRALAKATLAISDQQATDHWTLQAAALGVQMQISTKIEWLRRVRELMTSPDGADCAAE